MSKVQKAADVIAMIDALPESERAEVAKKYTPAEKSAEPAPVAKADGETAALRKQLDDERAAREALEKRLTDTEEKALTKELTADAGGYVLPGLEKADVVEMLKSARRGKPVSEEKLRKLFDATTEVVNQHNLLFKTAGLSYPGDEVGNGKPSASAQIEKHAEDFMKGDGKLTKVGARIKAREMFPDLAEQERAESEAARN